MGLANERSLAWGISKKLREAGAELAFSYQGEALEKRVRPLAAELSRWRDSGRAPVLWWRDDDAADVGPALDRLLDRKSTRLNSSHRT
mgnify:CR=1 FL=1